MCVLRGMLNQCVACCCCCRATPPVAAAAVVAPKTAATSPTGMRNANDGPWKYVYDCLTCMCFKQLCMVYCSFCSPLRTAQTSETDTRSLDSESKARVLVDAQPLVPGSNEYASTGAPPATLGDSEREPLIVSVVPVGATEALPKRSVLRTSFALRKPLLSPRGPRSSSSKRVAFGWPVAELPMIGLSTAGCQVYGV